MGGLWHCFTHMNGDLMGFKVRPLQKVMWIFWFSFTPWIRDVRYISLYPLMVKPSFNVLNMLYEHQGFCMCHFSIRVLQVGTHLNHLLISKGIQLQKPARNIPGAIFSMLSCFWLAFSSGILWPMSTWRLAVPILLELLELEFLNFHEHINGIL